MNIFVIIFLLISQFSTIFLFISYTISTINMVYAKTLYSTCLKFGNMFIMLTKAASMC